MSLSIKLSNRANGLIGILAVTLSILTIIVMAAVRTDGYDHLHKAISELGSLDAPNKWVFNIFGYIVPGMLISIFSLNLLKEFRPLSVKSYPFYLFFASGLFMSLAGFFPANMEDRQSVNTIIHSVGSFGSGAFWLVCALTLWWQLKKKDGWKLVAISTFLIPFVMIIAMSMVSENTPGLAQRIAFSANYLFILIIAIKLLMTESGSPSNPV